MCPIWNILHQASLKHTLKNMFVLVFVETQCSLSLIIYCFSSKRFFGGEQSCVRYKIKAEFGGKRREERESEYAYVRTHECVSESVKCAEYEKML